MTAPNPFDRLETGEERGSDLDLRQLIERASAKQLLILGPIMLVGHVALLVFGFYAMVRVVGEQLERLGMLFQ